ncbi:MAG: lamin tail domain-containing protein [Myxococcota bacterium]|nr:lamin tail domain-containing protein [Myxococcota bacterium]
MLTITLWGCVACSGAVGPDDYNPNDVVIRNGAIHGYDDLADTSDATAHHEDPAMNNDPDNANRSASPTAAPAVPNREMQLGQMNAQGQETSEGTSVPVQPFLWEILADPSGDNSDLESTTDWLEIHNPSETAIALDRWTLRRIKMGDFEPEIDDKIFDDGRLLMPGQYLVIWAYREVDAGPPGLNAGFKLSKFGMVRLMLMDPEGAVVDEVEYPEILDGASYARQSISAEDWQIVEADLVTRGRPNAAAAP